MNYVKYFNINGVDTKQVACIELQGAPNAATEGAVGVLGMDMTSPTHEVYRCVAVNGAVYTWELLSAGLSIISSTITGEGGESKVFPYNNLRIPNGYLLKAGDLIIDSEGYLYQVKTIGSESCEATYCGTHLDGNGGSNDHRLAVKNGKLQLVTDSGNVLSAVDYGIPDGTTICRNSGTGALFAMGVRTVNDSVLRFFVGSQEDYNNLTDEQKKDLFAIITDDNTKKEIFDYVDEVRASLNGFMRITNIGELATKPVLMYKSLGETGIVSESCTTDELLLAMPQNTSIGFTINTNDLPINITDAPFANNVGNSYGFCVLFKGWTNNYCYGYAWDIYGEMYYYKYHTGTNVETNGWHKLYSDVNNKVPTVNTAKKLTSPGYYYIKAHVRTSAFNDALINFGLVYFDASSDTRGLAIDGVFGRYIFELFIHSSGDLTIQSRDLTAPSSTTDQTANTEFHIAPILPRG